MPRRRFSFPVSRRDSSTGPRSFVRTGADRGGEARNAGSSCIRQRCQASVASGLRDAQAFRSDDQVTNVRTMSGRARNAGKSGALYLWRRTWSATPRRFESPNCRVHDGGPARCLPTKRRDRPPPTRSETVGASRREVAVPSIDDSGQRRGRMVGTVLVGRRARGYAGAKTTHARWRRKS